MAKKVKLGSTKRYGPRYGRRNKEKVANLEKEHRGRHKCPYCTYVKVVRLTKGIWACEKCGTKFAGKAYTYEHPKSSRIAAKKEEEPLEDIEEMEEEALEEEHAEDEQPEEEQEKEELSEKAEVA